MITSRPKVVGKKIIGVTTVLEYDLLSTGEFVNPRVLRSYAYHPDIRKQSKPVKQIKTIEIDDEVGYL